MRKNLLSTVFVAILLVFVGCSSDSSSSSCNEAALEAEFEAAAEKYQETGSNEDCLKAVAVIKKALANKCITQAEADTYASEAGLDCYTSGGGDNEDGDCEDLADAAEEAVTDFVTGEGSLDCEEVATIVNTAKNAGCLSAAQIALAEQHLPCF